MVRILVMKQHGGVPIDWPLLPPINDVFDALGPPPQDLTASQKRLEPFVKEQLALEKLGLSGSGRRNYIVEFANNQAGRNRLAQLRTASQGAETLFRPLVINDRGQYAFRLSVLPEARAVKPGFMVAAPPDSPVTKAVIRNVLEIVKLGQSIRSVRAEYISQNQQIEKKYKRARGNIIKDKNLTNEERSRKIEKAEILKNQQFKTNRDNYNKELTAAFDSLEHPYGKFISDSQANGLKLAVRDENLSYFLANDQPGYKSGYTCWELNAKKVLFEGGQHSLPEISDYSYHNNAAQRATTGFVYLPDDVEYKLIKPFDRQFLIDVQKGNFKPNERSVFDLFGAHPEDSYLARLGSANELVPVAGNHFIPGANDRVIMVAHRVRTKAGKITGFGGHSMEELAEIYVDNLPGSNGEEIEFFGCGVAEGCIPATEPRDMLNEKPPVERFWISCMSWVAGQNKFGFIPKNW